MNRNSTLTLVINGDWNKYYIQPEWIAKNVFHQTQIEMTVVGIGIDVSVSYRYNNISFTPSQNRIVFTLAKVDDNSLDLFCETIRAFFTQAFTPNIIAYGLNSDYIDSGDVFAEELDRLSANSMLYDKGFEVVNSKINRILKYNNKIFNVNCELIGSNLKVHINEHHEKETLKDNLISLSTEYINGYFEDCWKIVEALGYERE